MAPPRGRDGSPGCVRAEIQQRFTTRSTKSLSGHSRGAAGVQEAIYSLLMMQHGFAAASASIDTLEAARGLTEGDLNHGQPIVDQISFMRPVPDWSDHRTPGADAS